MRHKLSATVGVSISRGRIRSAKNVEFRTLHVPAQHHDIGKALGVVRVHVGKEDGTQFLRSDWDLGQPHACAAAGIELQLHGTATVAIVAIAHEGPCTGQIIENQRAALGAGQRQDQTGGGFCRCRSRDKPNKYHNDDRLHLRGPVYGAAVSLCGEHFRNKIHNPPVRISSGYGTRSATARLCGLHPMPLVFGQRRLSYASASRLSRNMSPSWSGRWSSNWSSALGGMEPSRVPVNLSQTTYCVLSPCWHRRSSGPLSSATAHQVLWPSSLHGSAAHICCRESSRRSSIRTRPCASRCSLAQRRRPPSGCGRIVPSWALSPARSAAQKSTEPLLENEIVVVGRPGLVPDAPSRECLRSWTWISREEGSATRSASDAALARLSIVPRRRLELLPTRRSYMP